MVVISNKILAKRGFIFFLNILRIVWQQCGQVKWGQIKWEQVYLPSLQLLGGFIFFHHIEHG